MNRLHVCPRCGRNIGHTRGRWNRHGTTTRSSEACPMSKQPVPITGVNPVDYGHRANLVCDLAFQVRDEDPTVVWDYLTALPADEVQRLLMVALAAIDVEAPLDRLYGWVYDLPAAKAVS